MLSGARQRAADDDPLLAEMSVMLDSLHSHFASAPQAVPPVPSPKENALTTTEPGRPVLSRMRASRGGQDRSRQCRV